MKIGDNALWYCETCLVVIMTPWRNGANQGLEEGIMIGDCPVCKEERRLKRVAK